MKMCFLLNGNICLKELLVYSIFLIYTYMTKLKKYSIFINERIENNTHLKPVETNRYIYHQSNPIFRDDISKYGLIPKGKSEAWLSDTEIDGEVVFATNSDNKEDWFYSTYDDDRYQIDTTKIKNKWYLDPNFDFDDYHIITFEPIPLNAIKLIYKGTGESE